MKYISKYLFFIGFALMVFGCESNIDLDPQDRISTENFFKSQSDFEVAIVGCYNQMNIWGSHNWLDGASDDGIVIHSWNKGFEMGRGTGNSNSPFPWEMWNIRYVTIQRANQIINNMDGWVVQGNQADKDRIMGEAKVFRGYAYLELAALFGDVPLIKAVPSLDESKDVRREDRKVVFEFAIQELSEAADLLPANANSVGRITSGAANALLGRAALYVAGLLNDKSYYAIAASASQKVIESKKYDLHSDYAALFLPGSDYTDEIIWDRQYTNTPGYRMYFANWMPNSAGGYSVTCPTKALVDAFECTDGKSIEESPLFDDHKPYNNRDPRLSAAIYYTGNDYAGMYYNSIPNNIEWDDATGGWLFKADGDYGDKRDMHVAVGDVRGEESWGGSWNQSLSGYNWKKYSPEYLFETSGNIWTDYTHFNFVRYAEVLLIRAEALIEQDGGDLDEAVSLINKVRKRVNMPEIANEGRDVLREKVRNERRVELANEGLRLYDIHRWDIAKEVMSQPAEGVEYYNESGEKKNVMYVERFFDPAKNKLWPIPLAELDVAPWLGQNPGW